MFALLLSERNYLVKHGGMSNVFCKDFPVKIKIKQHSWLKKKKTPKIKIIVTLMGLKCPVSNLASHSVSLSLPVEVRSPLFIEASHTHCSYLSIMRGSMGLQGHVPLEKQRRLYLREVIVYKVETVNSLPQFA